MTKTTMKEELETTQPTPAEAPAETPAQQEAENTVPETAPKKPEKEWLKREIKDSDLEEVFKIIKEYEFPDEAIQQTTHPTMKKEILGYNAQYIINALNEILGMNHWREYGEMKEEKPGNAYVSIYNGTFEIGNWKTTRITEISPDGTRKEYDQRTFEHIVRHTTYWGSRNMDHWESLKGAKTNFLKKICSYYSLGWKSYALQLDDDFMNMASDKWAEAQKPAPQKPQNTTPAWSKATPPTNKAPAKPQEPEVPKPISEAQIKMINSLYTEYLEKTPAGSAKTIDQLIAPYKKTDLKELTSKQGSEFITQFKNHVTSLK